MTTSLQIDTNRLSRLNKYSYRPYKRNPSARNKYAAEYAFSWRRANAERAKNIDLKCKYGITLAQYNELLNSQGGLCAICRKPETRTIRGKVISMAVDHDHMTGDVRGLLCCDCNTGIGLLNHDSALLHQALRYLSDEER